MFRPQKWTNCFLFGPGKIQKKLKFHLIFKTFKRNFLPDAGLIKKNLLKKAVNISWGPARSYIKNNISQWYFGIWHNMTSVQFFSFLINHSTLLYIYIQSWALPKFVRRDCLIFPIFKVFKVLHRANRYVKWTWRKRDKTVLSLHLMDIALSALTGEEIFPWHKPVLMVERALQQTLWATHSNMSYQHKRHNNIPLSYPLDHLFILSSVVRLDH